SHLFARTGPHSDYSSYSPSLDGPTFVRRRADVTAANPGLPGGLEPTLPSFWYQREDVYALEQEHIFFKEWMCVAREEELPRPGDHRVLDVCGQSILLVRNSEGALRAFYNVCRHRGAQLCAPKTAETGLAIRGGVMSNGTI